MVLQKFNGMDQYTKGFPQRGIPSAKFVGISLNSVIDIINAMFIECNGSAYNLGLALWWV